MGDVIRSSSDPQIQITGALPVLDSVVFPALEKPDAWPRYIAPGDKVYIRRICGLHSKGRKGV